MKGAPDGIRQMNFTHTVVERVFEVKFHRTARRRDFHG